MGIFCLCKVNSQAVVGLYFYGRLIFIELGNGPDAFFGRWHIGFVYLIAHDANHQTVEQRESSGHDRIVTHSKRIETPNEYTSSYHSGSKFFTLHSSLFTQKGSVP